MFANHQNIDLNTASKYETVDYIEIDGTKHTLTGEAGSISKTSSNTAYISLDSSYMRSIVPSGGNPLSPANLYYKDGAQWGGALGVEDTNGNVLDKDTLGRTFTYTNGPNGLASVSYLASDGSTATIQFNYTPYSTDCGGRGFPSTVNFLSSVVLPNNQTYQFQYDSNRELSKMTLPTGGYFRYQYNGPSHSTDSATHMGAVSVRAISVDGVSEQIWNYGFNATTQASIVTDPMGYQEFHYFNCCVTNLQGYETKIEYKNASGNLLRTILKSYVYDPQPIPSLSNLPGNAKLASITTILENNQQSQTTFDYDSFGNVTQEKEYDYGSGAPGSLLRRTTFSYLHSSNASYLNAHILDRVTSKAVYDSLNNTCAGQSHVCAQTLYTYDSTALISTSGAPNHDYTNYSTGNTVRGHVTQVQRWLNTNSSYLSTTSIYDDLGNLRSAIDPLSHTTTYDYTDNFSDGTNRNAQAFVTTITHPATNGVSHIEREQYYWNVGLPAATCGQNFPAASACTNSASTPQPDYTKFTYDLVNRPLNTTRGDGGQTSFSYNDTVQPLSVSSTQSIATGLNLTNTNLFDGLGRVSQSQLNSDPDCPSGDKTDITYDALGRASTVSNPYCTTSDTTYGLTTFTYDGLGRTTQVTHPDNNMVLTTYTGRATQVQDEGNGTQRVTRISQIDGLGRLSSLCEVAPGPFVGAGGSSSSSLIGSGGTPAACGQDIAGTGFLTTYQYDTLSNLLQVNQAGIAPRTFTYDSLSRLVTASNPESGTIFYGTYSAGVCQGSGYDANGNLLAKTALAPNQTGTATVTTTYQYDALNRLTQKSYNDGTTPTVTNTYDAVCSSSVYHNQVGRLSYAAVPGWGFCLGYDTMGRLLDKDLSMSAGTLYLDYTYDLLGDITSQTAGYGSATYSYNTAGRPATVTSSYSDPNNPATVFSAAHYNAFGGLTSDTLGNGETETYSYVPKLTRLQSYTAKLNATTIYNFNIGTFAPNGDTLAATDTANGNWTYTYDPFIRLVGSNKNSGAAVYSYAYDRFGNRWQQNGPQTFLATFTGNNQSTPANNNRMDGYSHDAAGNLLSDGTHSYTYDAENRLIKVDNGTTATYTYDADGNRVQKVSSTGSGGEFAGTWQFLYDQSGRMVQRFNGTLWQGNIYVGGRHLVEDGGGTNFSHSDWLGTERVRTTNTGTVCESIASLPFGDGQTTTGACYHSSPLHFTGKERDSESGLDDFGARYFGSSVGRFTSPDPLLSSGRLANPQTWNRYSYALNNPLRIVDPTGLYDWDESAGGDMSDEELRAIADDKHNKRHQWAQNALNFRDQFRSGLDSADEAAGSSALSDDQQSAAQAAVNAYGTEGDGNGVTVGTQSGHGGSTILNDNDTISVKFGSSVKGDFLTATIAHEGAHVDQANAWLNGGESSIGNLSHYAREQAAWAVGSSIAQALGMKSYAPYGGGRDLQVWNKGWAAADIETLRSKGIGNILNYMRDHSSDADMQKTYTDEHHHQD